MGTTRLLRAGHLVAGAAAIALVATACGTATGQEVTGTTRVGTVTGKFIRVGGPVKPDGSTPTAPLSGQIKFTGAHRTFRVHVGKRGTFSTVLPVGSYQVVGRTPDITSQDGNGPVKDATCALPHQLKVTRHHPARIRVICAVP